MKYTFNIRLTTGERERREKLVLASAPSEVAWHIALKILGYLLFHEDRPGIEQGIGWHYKPDLVALDEHGQPKLWIDCGNIAVRKIDRVARKMAANARFVVMRRTRREVELLLQNMKNRVQHPGRVRVTWFEPEIVDELASWLDGSNEFACHREGSTMELAVVNRRGRQDFRFRLCEQVAG